MNKSVSNTDLVIATVNSDSCSLSSALRYGRTAKTLIGAKNAKSIQIDQNSVNDMAWYGDGYRCYVFGIDLIPHIEITGKDIRATQDYFYGKTWVVTRKAPLGDTSLVDLADTIHSQCRAGQRGQRQKNKGKIAFMVIQT